MIGGDGRQVCEAHHAQTLRCAPDGRMSGAGTTLDQTAGQLPVFCLAVLLVMTEPGLVHGRLRGRNDKR